MKSSIDICGFDTRRGDRYPKLQELYSKLFHKPFENAHDAYCDVRATADCFWKAFSEGMLKKEEFPYLLTSQEKESIADRYLNEGIEILEKYKKSENEEILCEALSCFEKVLRINTDLKDEVGKNCNKYAGQVLCGDINTESFFIKNKCASEYKLVQEALFYRLVKNYEVFKRAIDGISPTQIIIYPSWSKPSKYQEYKLCAINTILSIVKCCFDGTGTLKSVVEAKKWLDLGLELTKNIYSRKIYDLTYYLGQYYEESQRYEDAMSCYQQAKQFFPVALKRIGLMYLYGRGCSKSKRIARNYLKEAQLKGIGVSPFLEEANKWF